MVVDGFTLDLYCDVCEAEHRWRPVNSAGATFTGKSRTQCARDARKAGWTINWKRRTCRCPEHRYKRDK